MNEKTTHENNYWRSAVQLETEFIGSSVGFKAALRQLRANLVRDVMEQAGFPLRNAVKVVSHHLVGWSDSLGSATPRVLRGSPEAVRLLPLVSREEMPRPPPEWKSAKKLQKIFKGQLHAINEKLEFIQLQLIRDISQQADISEELAGGIVDRYLVGMRASKGPNTLFASPNVVELLEREGILKRRGDKGSSAKSEREKNPGKSR